MRRSRLQSVIAMACAAVITAVAGGSVWCEPLCAPPDARVGSCHAASQSGPALAEAHDCSSHSLSAFTVDPTRTTRLLAPIALSDAFVTTSSEPSDGRAFALEHLVSPPSSSPPPAIRVLRI